MYKLVSHPTATEARAGSYSNYRGVWATAVQWEAVYAMARVWSKWRDLRQGPTYKYGVPCTALGNSECPQCMHHCILKAMYVLLIVGKHPLLVHTHACCSNLHGRNRKTLQVYAGRLDAKCGGWPTSPEREEHVGAALMLTH